MAWYIHSLVLLPTHPPTHPPTLYVPVSVQEVVAIHYLLTLFAMNFILPFIALAVCTFVWLTFRHDLRCFWDHARSGVGSRWVWLQRRIAELNKQIYRLDHHVKESCPQDKFAFGAAPSVPSTTAAAAVLPQYVSLANGSVLEHLRSSNGGGLVAMGKTGVKHSGSNGFSHHHHTTGHAQCVPHLLLPEGLLGTKLQVKDLLNPSAVDRNRLFINDTSSSAARTRYGNRVMCTRVVSGCMVMYARVVSGCMVMCARVVSGCMVMCTRVVSGCMVMCTRVVSECMVMCRQSDTSLTAL